MPGNDENEGGCGRMCCSYLDCICNIYSCIINFPFCRCFLTLLALAGNHYMKAITIVASTVIAILTFDEIKDLEDPATIVFVYSMFLLLCSFITFKKRGYFTEDIAQAARQERHQRNQSRQREQVARQREQVARQREQVARQREQVARQRGQGQGARPRIRHDPEVIEQPPEAGALGNPVEQRQEMIAVDPGFRHVQEVPFDFHHADEPSESSNSVEPVSSSSDEPFLQAAPSDLDNNLPQSSTDLSTKSTGCSHLDDVPNEEYRYVDSLQNASDSGNNLPQSSTDPSTKSTRSTPLDATNEESRDDGSSQKAVPSDSGSNLPQSSTDPSTKSTCSTSLDVANEAPQDDESLPQPVPSDSGSNLPQSSNDPATQSTPLDVINEEPRNDAPLQQAEPSDSDGNLPSTGTSTM